MKIRVMQAAAIALLTAGTVSCATTTSSGRGITPNVKATLPGKPACFFLYKIMHGFGSWTVLSSDELIVYEQTYSNPYLVKLAVPVPGLRFDQYMGFRAAAHQGQICDGDLDQLIVPGRIPPGPVPIVAVHLLTVAEANLLLRQHGLKPPPPQGAGK